MLEPISMTLRQFLGGKVLSVPNMICAATARGMSLAGFGSSSDMWVTASGVPMVKAPLSTPVKNVTPLLQPTALFWLKSPHTAELLACTFGIAATTMMVTIPPTMTRNNPI